MNIENLKNLVALLSHEVSPKPSLTEVKAAYSSVVKYVRDGLLISEDMLGNSILRELLHIFVSDEKNLASIPDCVEYLRCLIELEGFLSQYCPSLLPLEGSPSPLSLNISEIKCTLKPLTFLEAYSFLDIIVRQINSPHLNSLQKIGIINIFSSAMKHGLLDLVIAVMDFSIKINSDDFCFPSDSFPYPSVKDAFKFHFKFLELLYSATDAFVEIKGVICSLNSLIWAGFHNMYYGRLMVKEKNGEEDEV